MYTRKITLGGDLAERYFRVSDNGVYLYINSWVLGRSIVLLTVFRPSKFFGKDTIYKTSDVHVPTFSMNWDTGELCIKPNSATISNLYKIYGFAG